MAPPSTLRPPPTAVTAPSDRDAELNPSNEQHYCTMSSPLAETTTRKGEGDFVEEWENEKEV